MHGLNFSCIPSVPEDIGVTAASLPCPVKGMRNLLPLPSRSQAFGRGKISDQQLRNLMRKLAIRIAREPDWPDKLPNAANNEDNPKIPSGYTYLLQLIAHDIVHTSISLGLADAGKFGFENCRAQALTLDTIFGGGPDVCPHAYQFSRVYREHQRGLPRTRLRVGRTQRNSTTADRPFDDIGRGMPIDVSDDGIPPWPQTRMLTEAFVADPRNDDHALISQLTVLFHRLHNLIIDMIEDAPETSAAVAYRNFICARLVSTIMYRKIIVWDVLQRLLHPSVFRYYILDGRPLVGSGKGVPVEFSQGAFRCGHSMVRNNYRVNGRDGLEAARALQLSSLRSPGFLPVTDTWTVKWEHFFELDATQPNYSRRLGPSFSAVARSEWFFPPLAPNTHGNGDAAGLPSRDLVSSIYAQLWSVPALIDELRRNPEIAAFLPPYDTLQERLANWLNSSPDPFGISETLGAEEVAILAADPPLPFFVLFEAALTHDGSASIFKGGGQHLGPLGSIIVAETVIGAIQENEIGIGPKVRSKPLDPGTHLKRQVAEACKHMSIDKEKLSKIPEIRTMTDVLKFMRQHGALPTQ